MTSLPKMSKPAWPILLLMLAFCAWIYQPGLAGPSVLDDGVNLRVLDKLQLSTALQLDIVSMNKSGPLGRPVSMASLVMEKRLLGNAHRVSKTVNLVLHCLVGLLVFLFSAELFRALDYGARAQLAALLVAVLWLFAPIFVSTVLYMVQRMAQLATLFALLSLWAYMRWRRPGRGGHFLWLVLVIVALPLAVLSKENALLVLPTLILLELGVLQGRDRALQPVNPRTGQLRRLHLALLATGILTAAGFLLIWPEWLIRGYLSRDFTLTERVITESRVLWRYMGQLLWVDVGRLGIYQDAYPLSRGLLQPVTSAWSLLGLLGLVAASFAALRSPAFRGVGVGLLFFLLAHSLESTIFPLEIYFEHRNYLPAVGLLFALVAAGMAVWRRLDYLGSWLLASWLLLFSHAAISTAKEVQLWSNDYLLHLTAVNRHPDSVRAQVEMARVMSHGGFLEVALEYLREGQRLEQGSVLVYQLREGILYCKAREAIPRSVFEQWRLSRADLHNDGVTETVYLLVKEIIDGACPQTEIEVLAEHWHRLHESVAPQRLAPKFYLALAQLENHNGGYLRALAYMDKLLERYPRDSQALVMKLYFLTALQMEQEREATLTILGSLRSEGLLSIQQQQNLDMIAPGGESVER